MGSQKKCSKDTEQGHDPNKTLTTSIGQTWGTASWALMKKSLFVCLIEDHKERRCTDKYIVLLFPKQQKVRSISTEYQKGPISGQG